MSACVCWDYETPDAECTCGAGNPSERERRDSNALRRYRHGNRVRVLPAYRGAGVFLPDGDEGLYTVVGELPNTHGAPDYYLAHGHCTDSRAWDVIVHPSRMVPA